MFNKKKVEEILQGHLGSGLSVEAYCRKLGIGSNRFYYWRKAKRDKQTERFVEVGGSEAIAEVKISEKVTVKVSVSEVSNLLRSLGCLA